MPSVEDSYTALGPNELGFHASRLDEDRQQAFRIGGHMTGARFGLLAFAGNFASNQGPNEQNNYSLHAGVEGASKDFTGVVGASFNRPGVYGQVEDHPPVPDGLLAGVLGAARTQQGVIGFSRAGDGLEGASFTGNAVRATSFFGSGVHSISGALSGVIGISGTAGPQVPNTANIAGVFGTSSNQPGVIGTSNAVIGVFGFSDNVGVVGQTTNPNSFAGFFSGNVVVNGTLTANVKNAVVTFPDRTQRVLHCMESPEHWFEDFGTAKLARGRGTVELDGDFAKVIKPADYHVFVTPEGDCRGLYVAEKKTASFEVRELGGGTSSVAFSYASSAGAATSPAIGALPRSIRGCRCRPPPRARRAGGRRMTRRCAPSSPAWRNRRASAPRSKAGRWGNGAGHGADRRARRNQDAARANDLRAMSARARSTASRIASRPLSGAAAPCTLRVEVIAPVFTARRRSSSRRPSSRRARWRDARGPPHCAPRRRRCRRPGCSRSRAGRRGARSRAPHRDRSP